jgi:hypothetical protein
VNLSQNGPHQRWKRPPTGVFHEPVVTALAVRPKPNRQHGVIVATLAVAARQLRKFWEMESYLRSPRNGSLANFRGNSTKHPKIDEPLVSLPQSHRPLWNSAYSQGGHHRRGGASGRQAGGEAFCWLAAWSTRLAKKFLVHSRLPTRASHGWTRRSISIFYLFIL